MKYMVQVRKAHNGYVTRCATDKWNYAMLHYKCINIGAPYTKRLIEISEYGGYKVIFRSKGL